MTTPRTSPLHPVVSASATSGRFPAVAISGAGPVGLAVALGLARAGVRSVVFEKKAHPDLHSRATLILPRTLEIFRQWGVLDALLAAGNRVPHVRLREPDNDHQILHVNFTKLADETATMFALAIPQDRTERILLEAVEATGLVDIRFATELLGFEQDSTDVRIRIRSGETETTEVAGYLVGADGAHSRVRGQLGVKLEGKTYPTQALLATSASPRNSIALTSGPPSWTTAASSWASASATGSGGSSSRQSTSASLAWPCTTTSSTSPKSCSAMARSRFSGKASITNTNDARASSGTNGSSSPATLGT
jgi:2-polyprenyl-6-methoxyphenol hydroxylase-like FAD-dependent oxidoreductase